MEDLTGIGKVITTLIEKISDATGAIYEPTRITRKAIAEAEAEVEANKIRILGEQKNSDLAARAASRFKHRVLSQQENIENVIEGVIPLLEESAKPSELDPDWLNRFVDNAERISSVDTQKLWAKLLAGEVNTPGSFSMRTLNTLSNMSSNDALLFGKLADFVMMEVDFDYRALVVSPTHELVKRKGLAYQSLSHLADIGLIRFSKGPSFLYDSEYFEDLVFLQSTDQKYYVIRPNKKNIRTNHLSFNLDKSY